MNFFRALLIIFVMVVLAGAQELQALDLFRGKKESGSRDQKTTLFPQRTVNEASRAHLLQQEMMDFSDRFTMAVWQALDQYLRGETDPQKRSAAEHWKVLYSAATMQIAAGRDPAGSLLDMAVLTDLSEWSVAHSWNPQVFGKGGEPLLEALRGMKKDLWTILDGILSTDQRGQLKAII